MKRMTISTSAGSDWGKTVSFMQGFPHKLFGGSEEAHRIIPFKA